MADFLEIISRIKYLTGKKRDKELADLFNISPADFLNRKKRGTLLPLIIEWGIHESVNLDWLLTGQGPMRRGREAPAAGEPVQPYTTTNEKHAEIFALVREILESGDDLIIRSFHERLKDYRIALRRNDETRSLKQQLGSLERKFKALEQRIGPPMEAGASADAEAEAVGAADAGSEKKAI